MSQIFPGLSRHWKTALIHRIRKIQVRQFIRIYLPADEIVVIRSGNAAAARQENTGKHCEAEQGCCEFFECLFHEISPFIHLKYGHQCPGKIKYRGKSGILQVAEQCKKCLAKQKEL